MTAGIPPPYSTEASGEARDHDSFSRFGPAQAAFFSLALLTAAATALAVPRLSVALVDWEVVIASVIATLLGALAGFAEILSRYRDEPMRPLKHNSGRAYVLVNGLISLLAFGVVQRYGTAVLPLLTTDPILRACLAGFGALVIFRSRIFVLRGQDGKDVPFGPEVLITRFLKTVDQTIDRQRATERQRLVFDLTREITDFAIAADFLQASLTAFQRLTPEEREYYFKRSAELKEISEEKMPSALKAVALGFLFVDVAGEGNMRATFENLRVYMQMQSSTRSQQVIPVGGSAARIPVAASTAPANEVLADPSATAPPVAPADSETETTAGG